MSRTVIDRTQPSPSAGAVHHDKSRGCRCITLTRPTRECCTRASVQEPRTIPTPNMLRSSQMINTQPALPISTIQSRKPRLPFDSSSLRCIHISLPVSLMGRFKAYYTDLYKHRICSNAGQYHTTLIPKGRVKPPTGVTHHNVPHPTGDAEINPAGW